MHCCPEAATLLVPRAAGSRERLCCTACEFVHEDNPLPVVAGIVEIDREVREELGWKARIIRLLGDFAFPEEDQLILAVQLLTDRSTVLPMAPGVFRPWTNGTGQAPRPKQAVRLTRPRVNSESITGALLG